MNLSHLSALASTAIVLVAAMLAIALLAALVGSPVYTHMIITMFVNLILVVGLQIFMGNTGILAFAHAGFMGIGAYASVIFSMTPTAKSFALPYLYAFLSDIQLPFLPSLLVGGTVAAAVAAVVGIPIMRLSDFAAAITAFALLVIIYTVLVHWTALTNGPHTLFGVEQHTFLWNSALWACLFVVVALWFKESKLGLQLRASRDDALSAAAVGIDIVRVRWVAFVLSAFVAGFGGGLWAHFITSFAPNAFFLGVTFVILAMLVIGGPATVSGAVAGTIIVSVLFQGLRSIENWLNVTRMFAGPVVGLTDVCLAVGLILTLILRPAGLVAREEVRLRLWPWR
ncbi:MAG: branched-chain amino acid ABC transporter permease [Rhodospirillales bacterium]|nr:branched-chain amino acid ABC transporter permease [Rhodospirillales bacterium]